MSRAMVATRAFRRQIPSGRPGRLWNWQPEPLRRGWRADLAVPAALLALAGLAGFALSTSLPVAAPAADEIVWLDAPPAAPPAPPTENVTAPESPEAVAAPVEPVPLEEPVPATEPAADPAFGLDDAVATGGLAVARGHTLARAAEEVVRPPIEAPPGPVMLAGVPGVTNPVVPRYPPRAEVMGIEARVVALVTTDTLGNVVGFSIEKSGGREFDESVRRAALSTRFHVPRREGRARAVAFRLPYDFRLE